MTRRTTALLIAVIAAALLSAAVGRAVLARRQSQAELAAPAAAPTIALTAQDVHVVHPTTLQRVLSLSGTLSAVNTTVVKAKVAAEVRTLNVREGDAVRAGQILGRLDATDAEARLRQAQEQAQSAKAQLDIAERTLANNRALVDQGFISRNALDTASSNAAAARATLMAARAAADVAGKAVTDAVLRAPIGGSISQRLVQPGEKVGVDTRLLEIVDLSRIEFEAALAPEDLTSLRPGLPATLHVDGLAEPLQATIARINPAAEAGTRAVMVYFSVQPHPGIRHGLFATGELALPPLQGLAVPESAVLSGDGSRHVLVADNGVVTRRTIVPGGRGRVGDLNMVVAEQGLTDGAIVLSAAAAGVPVGARVSVTTPSGAPAPASAPQAR